MRFIAAGGDLVEPLREEREIHAALVAAVETGRIPAAQIARLGPACRAAESLDRGAGDRPTPPGSAHAEHRAWAAAIARDAADAAPRRRRALPLRRDARIAVLEFFHQWFYRSTAERPHQPSSPRPCAARFPNVTGVLRRRQRADRRRPRRRPRRRRRGRRRPPRHARRRIASRSRRSFVDAVARLGQADARRRPRRPLRCRSPIPPSPTALATYGADAAMLEALGAVLAGEETARGRLR